MVLFKQRVNNHLNGKGCPSCNYSKGELKIMEYLKESKIEYKKEYKFEDCKHKGKLRFDFYLPEYNTCIEYDGQQHFECLEYYGGQKAFESLVKRDGIKNEYCKNNNIKLIRIPYWDFDNIESILLTNLTFV